MANPPDSNNNKKKTTERNLAQPSSVRPPASKTPETQSNKPADPNHKLQTANLANRAVAAKPDTPPSVPKTVPARQTPAARAANSSTGTTPGRPQIQSPPPVPTQRSVPDNVPAGAPAKVGGAVPPATKTSVAAGKPDSGTGNPVPPAAVRGQEKRPPQQPAPEGRQFRDRPSRPLTRPEHSDPAARRSHPTDGQPRDDQQMPRRAGPPPTHPDRHPPHRGPAPRPRHYRGEPRRRMAPPAGAKPVGRFANRPSTSAAPPLHSPAPSNGSLGPLWFGILLLAGVGWLAIDHYTPRIQEDLLNRSRASLAAEGLGDTTDVRIDGRNITITGNVADQQTRDRAEEVIAGTFGVRAVTNELEIGEINAPVAPAEIAAPTLGMSVIDGKATLSGAVSDAKFAESIKNAAIAQYGEGNVVDELQIDPNATNPGWTAAVNELQADLATVENSSLTINNNTLTLTGNAQDETRKDAIGAKAQSLFAGQLEIDNQLEAPQAPIPSLPAFASAAESDSEIILNGFMSAASAKQIAAAYQDSNKTITNNISTHDLAETPLWIENFSTANAAMASVRDGKLTITRSGNVKLQGSVETDEQLQTIENQVRKLFKDTAVTNNITVVPPPVVPTMTPFASIVQTPEKIMVSGLLPEAAAKLLLKSYRATGAEVSNNIAVDERVMQPLWGDALSQSLGQLDGIDNAAVSMTSSGELVIRGEAQTDQGREAAAQNVAALFGDSVSLRNDISVKTPTITPPPKPDVSALLAQLDLSGILFKSGSADLDGSSIEILDQVVNILSQNTDANILIAGHTDSRGNADYNFNLSASRADAVQQHMINQGISATRLTARGYGPTQPIATNDTVAGRAQNRRIEIQLTGE